MRRVIQSRIIAPSFVHPSAEIHEVGHRTSCFHRGKLQDQPGAIQGSIIEEGTEIKRTALTNSLIGRNCYVEGQPNGEEPMS